MPGLIDAHVHVCLDGSPTVDPMYHKLPEEVTISAMLEAKKDLMAGFTTIRDEGGVNFSDIAVKKAIDNKLIKGPRMFVSGPALTSIGGHGDSHFSPQILNASLGIVVNGADEARNAARLNLKYGADQIKLFATGGVMSFGDEPGAAELTFDEMKAALEIANLKGRISSVKTIYTAADEEAARKQLKTVTEKWSGQYPSAMNRWHDNWDAISPIFKFSKEVRTAFYTTNAIESLNSCYRRLNKQRSVFPSSQALLKALYLGTFEIAKKWTMPIRNWGKVRGELEIMYPDRMQI